MLLSRSHPVIAIHLTLSTIRTLSRTCCLVVLILSSLVSLALKAGNKIVAKDEVAKTLVDAIPDKPGTVQDAILRNQQKKKAEQLKIGQRVLDADPEGAGGYNAFVNEPAEASARQLWMRQLILLSSWQTTHGFKTTLVH